MPEKSGPSGIFPVPHRASLGGAAEFPPERYGPRRAAARGAPRGESAVVAALRVALGRQGIAPKDVLCVAGAEAADLVADGLSTYVLAGPAGRSLPLAAGARLANPGLTVLALAGAAETLGESCGLLVHAARANFDFVFVMLDARPFGRADAQRPLDPVALALAAGATFAARADAADAGACAEILFQALRHKGFSYVHVLCPGPAGSAAGGDGSASELGVLREDSDAPTYEDLDPTISRRGAAVRETLALSKKEEIEALRASLR